MMLEGADLAVLIAAAFVLMLATIVLQHLAYHALDRRHQACRHELGKIQREKAFAETQRDLYCAETKWLRELQQRKAEYSR